MNKIEQEIVARNAELERERDEAQHLLAHTREWNTDWLLKNKERVAAATARAERLEAALQAIRKSLVMRSGDKFASEIDLIDAALADSAPTPAGDKP